MVVVRIGWVAEMAQHLDLSSEAGHRLPGQPPAAVKAFRRIAEGSGIRQFLYTPTRRVKGDGVAIDLAAGSVAQHKPGVPRIVSHREAQQPERNLGPAG